MIARGWERWAPLTGALAIVLWVVAFRIASSSPSTTDSDADITAYFHSHSHQIRDIVGYLIWLAGVVLLLVFLASLRSRLVAAEGGRGTVTALAFAAGIVSAVLWFLAITIYTAPAFAANHTAKFRLDPDSYRLINDLAYGVWVGAAVVGAVLVWATSLLALCTVVLPRWFGWIGLLAGVLQMFAVFFLPAFVFW